MKKLLLMFLPVLTAFLLVSCEDTGTDPIDPGPSTGSILLQSTPTGASIFVDGNNTGKVTPDSVTNLSAGTRTVRLSLTGYEDTTFTVTVTAGIRTSVPHVQLRALPDLQTFTTIRLYERASNNFSGLDLSEGEVVGSGGPATDVYYEGLVGSSLVLRSQHLRTPAPATLRETYFNNTNISNLNDGADSPVYVSGSAWTTEKSGIGNYSFLFDEDSHYSKLKITNSGEGGPFDKWIEVEYIYNKTMNDPRF
jgi:hypothetical protein